MQAVFTGIALAACAGLNAFIPILALAVYDRVSDSFELTRPFDFVSSTAGILLLLVIVTFELLLDKIPRVDAIMDLVGYVVRPASGAFLFMAVTYGQDSIDVVVAMMAGLLIAGAVHVLKARNRLRITESTDGMANPMISLTEDMVVGVVSVLALLFPVAGIVATLVGGGILFTIYNRLAGATSLSSAARVPTGSRQSSSSGSNAN